jgi:hypothetical protein
VVVVVVVVVVGLLCVYLGTSGHLS